MRNKALDFWKYIEGFDFISLSETWIDEKNCRKLKNRLPKTHVWGCKYAIKERKRKGKAKGGFIIGKRRN